MRKGNCSNLLFSSTTEGVIGWFNIVFWCSFREVCIWAVKLPSFPSPCTAWLGETCLHLNFLTYKMGRRMVLGCKSVVRIKWVKTYMSLTQRPQDTGQGKSWLVLLLIIIFLNVRCSGIYVSLSCPSFDSKITSLAFF